jgi:hypothetical protein
MNAPVNAAGAAPSAAAAIPVGFDELASSRITLVDVYFGGRKVIETLALTQPGSLKLRSPGDVLAKLPQVIVTPELSSALAGELPTNSGSVSSMTRITSASTFSSTRSSCACRPLRRAIFQLRTRPCR